MRHRLGYEDASDILWEWSEMLAASIEARHAWMEQGLEGGWQQVQARRGVRAAAATGDVLQHWLASDPLQDWQMAKEHELRALLKTMEAGGQAWEQAHACV